MIPPDDLENRLREYRLDAGLTLREVAARCGLNAAMLSQIELGYVSPLDSKGNLRRGVANVLELFNAELVETFPREICRIIPGSHRPFETPLLACQTHGITAGSVEGYEQVDAKRFAEKVRKVVFGKRYFSPRSQKVIALVFWEGYSFVEAARFVGLSSARAGQAVHKFLNFARHYLQEGGPICAAE